MQNITSQLSPESLTFSRAKFENNPKKLARSWLLTEICSSCAQRQFRFISAIRIPRVPSRCSYSTESELRHHDCLNGMPSTDQKSQ